MQLSLAGPLSNNKISAFVSFIAEGNYTFQEGTAKTTQGSPWSPKAHFLKSKKQSIYKLKLYLEQGWMTDHSDIINHNSAANVHI